MIGNGDGGSQEKVRSSGGRSFQRRGAGMDMARFENMRWEVTRGRERVREEDHRVERLAGWWRGSLHIFELFITKSYWCTVRCCTRPSHTRLQI